MWWRYVWLYQMRYLAIPIVMVVAVCAVGCTTVNTPATAPDTTAGVATTSTSAPEVTTSTTAETTTTLNRVAEITAIFEDLERRRLEAIYSGDVEAFEALYANTEYLDLDRISLERVTVIDSGALRISDLGLISDQSDCVAFSARIDASRASEDGGAYEVTVVLERAEAGGDWGYSWVGEGWSCDGPHPLSG